STSTDFLSDKATSAFIRRVLCSQHLAERGGGTPAPIEELLPPLTSRNDVDLQLYALLAVILRDFVQAWYSKITPDETFVTEIIHIVAHCTRALEQRIREVDLESLLLDELPDLLDRHIIAYRTAHEPVARPPTQADPREIYHALCPIAPLSPVPKPDDPQSVAKQKENETVYRQLLVQGVLAVLLPTEDLENECLTSLVGEIFSELIIGNVFINRLSQPWLIWECLIILTRVLGRKKGADSGKTGPEQQQSSRRTRSPQTIFWSFVQWLFLAFSWGRVVVLALASAPSLPARSHLAADQKRRASKGGASSAAAPPPEKVPVVTFKLWTCVSDLVELDARMPWLGGTLSMLQLAAVRGPWRPAGLDGPLDRLFSHAIRNRMLDPSHLPVLLRSIRGALFPNNAPGTSTLVAPSSDRQLRALRRRCASALWALLPGWLSRLYLSGRLTSLLLGGFSLEGILDVFSDEYCNRHLLYGVLELILVRLMPELADKGVADLLDERL
ncbi:hypothetical protein SODALDRAFT_247356, partial [Sodiomyces alkalinus F11]